MHAHTYTQQQQQMVVRIPAGRLDLFNLFHNIAGCLYLFTGVQSIILSMCSQKSGGTFRNDFDYHNIDRSVGSRRVLSTSRGRVITLFLQLVIAGLLGVCVCMCVKIVCVCVCVCCMCDGQREICVLHTFHTTSCVYTHTQYTHNTQHTHNTRTTHTKNKT